MRHKKILMPMLVCIVLSCTSEFEPVPAVESVSLKDSTSVTSKDKAGARILTQTLVTMSVSTLQTGFNTSLANIRSTPFAYQFTQNNVPYIKLKNITGGPGFNFMEYQRLFPPGTVDNLTMSGIRADCVTKLNQMNVGADFKSNLLSSFDFINTIDTKTFTQFETHFESKLTNIGKAISPYVMTDKEKFVLTQSYYAVLALTKWFYLNPTPPPVTNHNACLPGTQEEWKAIARNAMVAGIIGGLQVGISGAIAGTIASANPVVGGAVGGLIGFYIGFFSRANLSIAVQVIYHCLENKVFVPKFTFICGGNEYSAYTASPPVGCQAGALGPITTFPPISAVTIVDFNQIYNYGLIPNKGRTTVNSTVLNDINWLLSFW